VGEPKTADDDASGVASARSDGAQTTATVTETRELLRTKWYYYNDDGNVTRVVTAEGTVLGYPNVHAYSATRMAYAKNQRTVVYAVGEKWNIEATNPDWLTGYVRTYAFQYRYDGARQRYLKRQLQTPTPWSGSTLYVAQNTWTDYDGDQPYGDFEVVDERTAPWDPPLWVTHELRSFDLGMGSFAWTSDSPDTTTVTYDHRDMIGTLRATSDSAGAPTPGPVYTAFG